MLCPPVPLAFAFKWGIAIKWAIAFKWATYLGFQDTAMLCPYDKSVFNQIDSGSIPVI